VEALLARRLLRGWKRLGQVWRKVGEAGPGEAGAEAEEASWWLAGGTGAARAEPDGAGLTRAVPG
jgi:hypothetical protein